MYWSPDAENYNSELANTEDGSCEFPEDIEEIEEEILEEEIRRGLERI